MHFTNTNLKKNSNTKLFKNTTLFFFFMTPQPQRSTLFPYTTLFRSHIHAASERHRNAEIIARRDIAGTADRKSTRLNSSHQIISYAVFCLKKKNAGPGRHKMHIFKPVPGRVSEYGPMQASTLQYHPQ